VKSCGTCWLLQYVMRNFVVRQLTNSLEIMLHELTGVTLLKSDVHCDTRLLQET